jgi:hypothetical protein
MMGDMSFPQGMEQHLKMRFDPQANKVNSQQENKKKHNTKFIRFFVFSLAFIREENASAVLAGTCLQNRLQNIIPVLFFPQYVIETFTPG